MLRSTETLLLEADNRNNKHSAKQTAATNYRIHILLVEDVYSDAKLVRTALDATRVPFSLTRLKRGDELLLALSSDFKSWPVDLIMLDLGLPGMDGFEVLAEISRMPAAIRSIPIVILTAHKDFAYLSRIYPYLHIMDYVNKPCGVEHLHRILMQTYRQSGYVSTMH